MILTASKKRPRSPLIQKRSKANRGLPHLNAQTHRAWAFDLCAVFFLQIFLSAWFRYEGFHGISDDDYARVVIAQQFAAAPTGDPSGTSWLPAPFIFLGTMLRLTAPSLDMARLFSVLLSGVSSCLLYSAARLLIANRRIAVFATIFALALPYSLYLSAATVPEYPTACALVFASTTLLCSQNNPGRRLLGSFALFLACASRYEAWPAALAFASITALDLHSSRKRASASPLLLASLIVSCAFPLLWIYHGVLHHENAFFFVNRVVDYKRALGAGSTGFSEALSLYPQGLIYGEPEVMFGLFLGVLSISKARLAGRTSVRLRGLMRPWLVLSTLLIFLILGAVRDGAPTHHAERALVSLWLLGALSMGHLLALSKKTQKEVLVAIIMGLFLGHALRRAELVKIAPFSNRVNEEQMGEYIRDHLPRREPLAIVPANFGYFAIMAAGEVPSRWKVLQKHDPREPTSSLESLRSLDKWRAEGGCYYVIDTEMASPPQDQVLFQRGSLNLLQASTCSSRSIKQ